MSARRMDYRIVRLLQSAPFRIAGYVFDHSDVLVVTLSTELHRGRGEAAGVYYLGEDPSTMARQLDAARSTIEACSSREELRSILPTGGARNAVDCAMWELEAMQANLPVWQLAGLERPQPLLTTMTIGADDPAAAVAAARKYSNARAIKVKLEGDLDVDVERVRAIRDARPEVWLGVDANQGYTLDRLEALAEAMVRQRVSLIEQPLARGFEADLETFESPIPIAADESALALADLETLPGRFNVVNIKLDKCGGLTEALMMVRRARELGLGVMVGTMSASSLGTAPGYLVGQLCDIADLDGPLFLQRDPPPAVSYDDGLLHCPDAVWGCGAAM